jgi:hypothetical protein
MSNEQADLGELWRVRNAAAVTLGLTEDQMRRAVQAASVAQLAALIETFSPARSAGAEWTRTFEPLVERLWAWRDDATIAALAETFRARGMPWMAVTNALSAEHGVLTRANLRQPASARLPAFTLG